MTLLVTLLFLITIAVSLAAGVFVGRWVIFTFLNFFDPKRPRNRPSTAPAMARTISGD